LGKELHQLYCDNPSKKIIFENFEIFIFFSNIFIYNIFLLCFMPQVMDKIEADIDIYQKARKKFDSCEHADRFYFIGSCRLFNYTFDTSSDMLHHCGSCKTNTSEPTTTKLLVRSP
jgi:transcription initiation factor IIE alpha subunit